MGRSNGTGEKAGTEVDNDRWRIFCREYLVDLNGAQAAIRAGYAPKAAKEIASRLLTKANVRAEIDRLMAERCLQTGVSAEWVIKELVDTYRSCREARQVYDMKGNKVTTYVFDDDGEEKVAAVYTFDSKGATKCLELLSKHTGVIDKKEPGPDAAALAAGLTINVHYTKPTPPPTEEGGDGSG